MDNNKRQNGSVESEQDVKDEGRDDYFMDIDRMINEGLGGGQVTVHNGKITDSTTDTMDNYEGNDVTK
ncbi:hypothetical protein [Paenibacillus sp. GCM10027626]|uniref:hypothetical protein n=1 Tax=Paenibacillus sp. GCM10027626 TaxID=3273411 RepID=UPI003640D1C9